MAFAQVLSSMTLYSRGKPLVASTSGDGRRKICEVAKATRNIIYALREAVGIHIAHNFIQDFIASDTVGTSINLAICIIIWRERVTMALSLQSVNDRDCSLQFPGRGPAM